MALPSNVFPNLIKHNEAVDLLYRCLRHDLFDTLDSNDSVTLNKTLSGAVIRLHNRGTRPTVYEISITRDKYNQANLVVLDTIINEQQSAHETLKVSFPFFRASHIINIASRLSKQQCDGDENLTLSKYQPMGILYALRANTLGEQEAIL